MGSLARNPARCARRRARQQRGEEGGGRRDRADTPPPPPPQQRPPPRAPPPPRTPGTRPTAAASTDRIAARAAAAAAALAALALAAAAAAALRPTPITPPSLALSTGGPDAPGGRVWVAFLGDVYDVSTSRRVYGPGGDYAYFAGRDATAAFISGDFGPAGLTPHLLPGALSDPDTLSTLRHWARFYARHPNYTRTGVLVGGPYYDGRGGRPRTGALSTWRCGVGRGARARADGSERWRWGRWEAAPVIKRRAWGAARRWEGGRSEASPGRPHTRAASAPPDRARAARAINRLPVDVTARSHPGGRVRARSPIRCRAPYLSPPPARPPPCAHPSPWRRSRAPWRSRRPKRRRSTCFGARFLAASLPSPSRPPSSATSGPSPRPW